MSSFHPAPLAPCLLAALLALSCTPAAAAALPAGDPSARQAYVAARTALVEGRMRDFRNLRRQLNDYPLAQYLDYYQLRRDLHRVHSADVRAFRRDHTDTPVASRLQYAWLTELARRQDWTRYLADYEPSQATELRCYRLEALLRTGERDRVLVEVPELWQVPRSQPKACDRVFDAWIAEGGPNEAMVWSRLRGALQANEITLASYLTRFLDGKRARWAQTFQEVHRNPKAIRNYSRFDIDNPYIRDILAHGIPRLVRTDPNDAKDAWAHYRASHAFDAAQARRIDQDLTIELARRGMEIADADLRRTPDGRHIRLADTLLRNAVQRSDWPAVIRWYDALPADQRTEPKWRYWYGRALTAPDHAASDPAAGQQRLDELAHLRHYYGFLAAHRLGTVPRLNERPGSVDPQAVVHVKTRAGMIRIRELLGINDTLNARREWHHLQGTLTPAELVAAAYLAADLGWTQQSIFAANAADLQDDLALRFPTPHLDVFSSESQAAAVPLSFLYGIARQESAFAPDAESSAGALGMMQLLPSTAALTARRMGLKAPPRPLLKEPDLNVKLGSRYLATLMARYDGNRALAAAAYNAGPGRVDRWLATLPAKPADVWIEAVPFDETRSYVKNVLAFSYIYSEKLGKTRQFLEPVEAN